MKARTKRFACMMLLLALVFTLLPAQHPVRAASGVNINNGFYAICSSINKNKVVDVKSGSIADGNNVQLYSANATTAQTFYIRHIADGYYAIVMAGTQSKALDIHGGTGYSGANVEVYTYHGGANQLWKFVPTGKSGEYYIVSKSGGVYLDVSGGSGANGANIQVYTGNQSAAQRWTLRENYNVTKAVNYALKYTDASGKLNGNTYNSADYNVYTTTAWNLLSKYRGYDCTNYLSQCLYAGGMIETSGWGRITKGKTVDDVTGGVSWVQARSLYAYLKELGYHIETVKSDQSNIHLGDAVFFDDNNDDIPYHASICTDVSDGVPKYSAHSSWRKNRPYNTSNETMYVVHMSFCTQSFPKVSSTLPNYFPACGSGYTSIVSALQSVGAESSYAYRKEIAAVNNISNYSGTAAQNIQMLNLLKNGKLIKPGSNSSVPSVKYFPACGSGYTSIVTALQSVGAESSYAYREQIAAVNNISNYSGTAAQNTQMLNLLKNGKLIKP